MHETQKSKAAVAAALEMVFEISSDHLLLPFEHKGRLKNGLLKVDEIWVISK